LQHCSDSFLLSDDLFERNRKRDERMASTKKSIGGFKRFQHQYFGDDRRLYASMKEG
jgi:hypothetical protein